MVNKLLIVVILGLMAYFDIRKRIIPDWLILPGLGSALFMAWRGGTLQEACLGALLGAVLMLPALVMGSGGDFKAGAFFGAVMGYKATAAFLVVLLCVFAYQKLRGVKSAPLGPFLAGVYLFFTVAGL